jgi:hypothetical protein
MLRRDCSTDRRGATQDSYEAREEALNFAFRDNRAAQHNAINDCHGFRRVMQGITLQGDAPRRTKRRIEPRGAGVSSA